MKKEISYNEYLSDALNAVDRQFLIQELIKIPDTNLVRDTKSMALINTDETARNEYFSKVQMMRVQKQEINKVNTYVTSVRYSNKTWFNKGIVKLENTSPSNLKVGLELQKMK